MTFEEFFSKKKISLGSLQSAEPGLFAEFKDHFEQMGEKSFDHTKKYWFNKLRLKYPAPIEVKTEKVRISNPLAEQTITESLEELPAPAPSPRPGFTPRFKAAIAPKPVEETEEDSQAEEKPALVAPVNETPVTPSPKPGFTPRFKAANMPKPVEKPIEEETTKSEPAADKPADDTPAEAETPATPAPKMGFTPRFKAANMPKPAEQKVTPPVEPAPETPVAETPKEDAPKPAYKPRFNPKNLPKKEE